MTDMSFFTAIGSLNLGAGYGVGGFNIVTSLQDLGYTVKFDNPQASTQLNFAQPNYCVDSLRKNQKQILLLPWESTGPMDGWLEVIKEDVDELWATSTWCKEVYESWGFKVEKVYPHGIETMFSPKKKRLGTGPIKFLHNGIPAPRKGGQQAFNAFRAAFGDDKDVQLVLKAKDYSDVREYSNGSIVGGPKGNVKVLLQTLEREQLPNLYHQADVFIGNSAGEGFGFPMLEALATGTPTICTKEWAEYKNFLGPLGLESTMGDSPWPEMHPGKVCHVDFDDLVDKLRFAKDNIEDLQDQFYKQSFQVHRSYDWVDLTEEAFKDVDC